MKLEDYFLESTTLFEDVEEIISIDNEKRHEINILILNVVIKYITNYLCIKETNIRLIKDKVHSLLDIISIIRGFDNLSVIQGNEPTLDTFGLDCLFDIKQTSAIFKEIAFDGSFDESEIFKSLDLGSGTGILSLATYIAGKRKKCKKGEIYFIDRSSNAIYFSNNIFQKLSGNFKFIGNIGDITKEFTYKNLVLNELSYLVLETIGINSPSFSLDINNGKLILFTELPEFLIKMMKIGDPFPYVMSLLTKISPELYKKIKNGKVGMFPNYPKKLYIPNELNSTLLLKSGLNNNPITLDNVGLEFSHFEDLGLGQERWSNKKPEGFENLNALFNILGVGTIEK